MKRLADLRPNAGAILYFTLLGGALAARLADGFAESSNRGLELIALGVMSVAGVIAAAWLWIALLKQRARRLVPRSCLSGARLGMKLPALTSGLRELTGWVAPDDVVAEFYAFVPTESAFEFWGTTKEHEPRVIVPRDRVSAMSVGVVTANRVFAAILLTVHGQAQPLPLVLFSSRLFRFTPMKSHELGRYLESVLQFPFGGEHDRD